MIVLTTKAVVDKDSKKYKEYCKNVTEDELNEIRQFAEFVKGKRK